MCLTKTVPTCVTSQRLLKDSTRDSELGEVATNGIAVDAATGDIYVGNYAQGGPGGVYEINSSGNYVSTWNGGALPNGAASETPNGNYCRRPLCTNVSGN